ncbi:MAG: hypothetical protein Q9187_006182, partial [Circinaria calcarea]
LSGSLQDMVSTNITNSWSPGNIGSYNFKAPLTQGIGLLVLENADYGIGQTGGGLRLYVANEQGLIQEYGYDAHTHSWASGFTFPESNGYGGVGSEYRTDNVTTLYLVNKNSKLEYWWRDWDEDPTFPSGSWNKGKLELLSPEYSWIGLITRLTIKRTTLQLMEFLTPVIRIPSDGILRIIPLPNKQLQAQQ